MTLANFKMVFTRARRSLSEIKVNRKQKKRKNFKCVRRKSAKCHKWTEN